ncbi:MAG: hypothetical protein IJA21_03540 [Clostridia bacterium]|nr:hypothetical protein [Clostridia bacterium]
MSKITSIAKKYSFIIYIVHTIMLFLPAFAKMSIKNGGINEQHSIINMLFGGIKPFWSFLFVVTVIVGLISCKILSQLFSKEIAVILQGVTTVANLILLFILRAGYMRFAIPVGVTRFAFWYYLIFDVLLILAAVSLIGNSEE